jgi:hypothetical protein
MQDRDTTGAEMHTRLLTALTESEQAFRTAADGERAILAMRLQNALYLIGERLIDGAGGSRPQ